MSRRTVGGPSPTSEPARLPPCLFCEKAIRPLEPVLSCNFIVPNDPRIGHVPAHMGCLVQAIAGETARAVLYAMRRGETDVGIERDEGEDLGGVLSSIVARIVERM